MESMNFDFQSEFGRDPDANALYLFTLGGLRVLHLGDTGNPIPQEHIGALKGNVDIMLALASAHATIAYDDLDAAIKEINPRVVIPMHYYHPRGWLQIEPVDSFLERYSDEMVTRIGGSSLELTPETLPPEQHIYVFEQSR